MFACVTRARCGSHLPSSTRAWAFPPSETLAKKLKNRYADVLLTSLEDHHVDDQLHSVEDEAVQDHEFHRHWFFHAGRWRIY